jgi:hypothetical protein
VDCSTFNSQTKQTGEIKMTITKRDPKITKQIRLVRKYIKEYAVNIRKLKSDHKESQRAYQKLSDVTGWGCRWEDEAGLVRYTWSVDDFSTLRPARRKNDSDAAYSAKLEAWEEYKKNAPCYPYLPRYHWADEEPEDVTALHILLHELKGDGKKHLADESDEYEYSFFVDKWRKRIEEEAEAENAES